MAINKKNNILEEITVRKTDDEREIKKLMKERKA